MFHVIYPSKGDILLANALNATHVTPTSPPTTLSGTTAAQSIPAEDRRLALDEKKQKLEAWAMFSRAKQDGDCDTMQMLSELFPEFQKFCPKLATTEP